MEIHEGKIIWKRKKMLFDAMLTIDSKSIVTSREIAAAVKNIAIEKWDYLAKENLKEIGFVTDKDIHEALSQYYAERIIEDPDPNYVEYDNVAIID